MRINVLHTVGAKLVVTPPGDHQVAVGQSGGGGIHLRTGCEGVNEHVITSPRAGGRKEPGVDALEALAPALPDKGRATTIEQGDLRAFLIGGTDEVHPEGGEDAGEVGIQLQGANSQAVAIGDAVLPNQVAASGIQAEVGMNLIRGQRTGDGVFHPIGDIGVGLAKEDRGGGNGQAPADQRVTGEE